MVENEIDWILETFDNDQLIKFFNYLGLQNQNFSKKSIEKIYDKVISTDLSSSPNNLVIVLHQARRLSLNIKHLLKCITENLLNTLSPTQVAIIYHSTYKYLDQPKLTILKEKILNDMELISPKLILNIAKDLVDDRNNYDKDYIAEFEPKASKLFLLHNAPSMLEFKTQLISFYFLRFKRERNLVSSDDESEE
jgi:hypothetical protein